MKAPDKLYIGRRNYGPLIGGWESQPFSSTEIESIEYIRKDALLEWAKVMRDCYDEKYNESGHTCGEHRGQRNAFKQMIDKLNSM